jgi:hypothetical protein
MAKETNTEEWRPIEGYPGYEASSLGNIRSLDRTIIDKNGVEKRMRGRVLAPARHGQYNYFSVGLGRGAHTNVHALVCTAFHGKKPSDAHGAAHNDGDGFNNRPENLRWATQKENMADTVMHGTRYRGRKHWSAKLSEDDVREIRRLCANGVSTASISTQFSISPRAVRLIRERRNWAWLQ